MSAIVVTIVAAALVTWLLFAGHAFIGYGSVPTAQRQDPGLDHFMPTFEIDDPYEISVDAPWTNTYTAECLVDLQDSPLVSSILNARAAIVHATPDPQSSQQPAFLAQALSVGWGVLAEDPGHEIIIGAVSQPWAHDVSFEALQPEQFAAFQTPGYVKMVWTLDAEPTGPTTSIARTVTRVETTDADSRSRFRTYWATVSPVIQLFREQALDLVKAAAERDYRANGPAPAKTCSTIESAPATSPP